MSKELIDKILQASAIINNSSRYGNSNCMVVSKAVVNIINNLRKSSRKEKIMRIFNEETQS